MAPVQPVKRNLEMAASLTLSRIRDPQQCEVVAGVAAEVEAPVNAPCRRTMTRLGRSPLRASATRTVEGEDVVAIGVVGAVVETMTTRAAEVEVAVVVEATATTITGEVAAMAALLSPTAEGAEVETPTVAAAAEIIHTVAVVAMGVANQKPSDSY